MSVDGHAREMLASYVRRAKQMMDDIADIQADLTDVMREAKSNGFDSTKIREVARWLRKVDKHGRPAMEEAEAIFDLYRSVVDGGAASFDDMMDSARDRALLKMFAPDDQVTPKINSRVKAAQRAATMARAAREAEQP